MSTWATVLPAGSFPALLRLGCLLHHLPAGPPAPSPSCSISFLLHLPPGPPQAWPPPAPSPSMSFSVSPQGFQVERNRVPKAPLWPFAQPCALPTDAAGLQLRPGSPGLNRTSTAPSARRPGALRAGWLLVPKKSRSESRTWTPFLAQILMFSVPLCTSVSPSEHRRMPCFSQGVS